MNPKTNILILACVLFVSPVVTGATGAENDPATPTATGSEADPAADVIEKGKKIFYSSTCVACHGENGQGTIPGVPDLTDPDTPLVTKSKEELIKNVKSGFRSPRSSMAMPPKGGDASLGEEDIRAVLKFMTKQFADR